MAKDIRAALADMAEPNTKMVPVWTSTVRKVAKNTNLVVLGRALVARMY